MPKAPKTDSVKAAVKVDGYQPQTRPPNGFYHAYECPSDDCLQAIRGRNEQVVSKGAIVQRAQRAIITEDKKPHSDVHCRNIVSGAPCNAQMEWMRTFNYCPGEPGHNSEVARAKQ